MKNIRLGAAGKNLVASVVQAHLNSDWQDIDAENDDGIDGLIFLRHRQRYSGRTLFVQVKSGKGYLKNYKHKKYNGLVAVDIGKGYVEKHRALWRTHPGPIILVYVIDPTKKPPELYWQDLGLAESFSKTNPGVVLIPKKQTFGSEAKGAFRRMCGAVRDDAPLPTIDLADFASRLAIPESSREVVRAFYKEWGSSSDRKHPELGDIEVTNAGWRHITRHRRRKENIHNSFLLLEAARQIVSEGTSWRQLGAAKRRDRSRTIDVVDHLALRALIRFRQRAPGPVQVILRRTRSFDRATGITNSRLIFLSVHELTRGPSIYYG